MASRAEEPTSDGRCVAVCRDCGSADDPLVVPFSAIEPLAEWARAHAAANDHTVRPLPGWPEPIDAFRDAFPPEETHGP